MKTYSEFICFLNEEAKWSNSLFNHLFLDAEELQNNRYIFKSDEDTSFELPLSSSFIKKISAPVEMMVMHSTGKEGLKNLLKLQNKKTKHLSAFTLDMYNTMEGGIWSDNDGGVIALLHGEVLAGSMEDIYSKPTKQGIRVIDIGIKSLLYTTNKQFFDEIDDISDIDASARIYKSLMSELLELRRSIIKEVQKHVKSGGNVNPYEIDGKIKQQFIRKYIGYTTKIITSNEDYRRVFNLILLQWPKNQKKNHETSEHLDYDELIVSNFKVLKVYIFEHAIKNGFDVDILKEKEIPYKIIKDRNSPNGTHKLMLKDLHLFKKQK